MGLQSAVAGLALGLLTGALVGLSTAPVVVSVLTAILALLAGFFAFGKVGSGPSLWRVAGFGFGGTMGLALGLMVRVQDLANASPAWEVARLTEAGFSPEQARELFTRSRYGSAVRTTPPAEAQPPLAASPARSGLFVGTAELCGRVLPLAGTSPEIARILLTVEAPAPRLAIIVRLLRADQLSGAEARTLLCDS
jgi:hypothetical protein